MHWHSNDAARRVQKSGNRVMLLLNIYRIIFHFTVSFLTYVLSPWKFLSISVNNGSRTRNEPGLWSKGCYQWEHRLSCRIWKMIFAVENKCRKGKVSWDKAAAMVLVLLNAKTEHKRVCSWCLCKIFQIKLEFTLFLSASFEKSKAWFRICVEKREFWQCCQILTGL